MANEGNALDSIKKELESDKQAVIESVNILFLDISSTCTGYSIADVNFTTKAITWKSAGAIWLDPKWTHQFKYLYMHEAISNYFWIVEQVDYIVVEQYSVNPRKMAGVNVVPEMVGAIKAAAAQNGVTVSSILPQTWRSQLGIKKIKLENSTFDYKGPTKDRILEMVKVPEISVSNITKVERKTPSDLYDSLGIGLGWLKKFGFEKNNFTQIKFNSHVGFLEEE